MPNSETGSEFVQVLTPDGEPVDHPQLIDSGLIPVPNPIGAPRP